YSLLLISLTILLFFFNVRAPTAIYTLSLHDALPISGNRSKIGRTVSLRKRAAWALSCRRRLPKPPSAPQVHRSFGKRRLQLSARSEEHTSELQSLRHLVCRLLLEKKKRKYLQADRIR